MRVPGTVDWNLELLVVVGLLKGVAQVGDLTSEDKPEPALAKLGSEP